MYVIWQAASIHTFPMELSFWQLQKVKQRFPASPSKSPTLSVLLWGADKTWSHQYCPDTPPTQVHLFLASSSERRKHSPISSTKAEVSVQWWQALIFYTAVVQFSCFSFWKITVSIMASQSFIHFILIQTCILGIWLDRIARLYPPLSAEKYSLIYITYQIFQHTAVRRSTLPSSLE